MKTAVYHFTDQSNKRPIICTKQLNLLTDFAISKNFTEIEIFCDMSPKKGERTEFDRFLSNSNQFDNLVCKDFYHISINTMKCMSIMQELKKKKVNIHTIENGSFCWEDAPYSKPLKVATYFSHLNKAKKQTEIVSVQNDILKLYVDKKTNWRIEDQYTDFSENTRNGNQMQLDILLKNKHKYNLILVHNLNNIHWRTAKFCKIREELQLDIYSLQDGFLKYNKEESICITP